MSVWAWTLPCHPPHLPLPPGAAAAGVAWHEKPWDKVCIQRSSDSCRKMKSYMLRCGLTHLHLLLVDTFKSTLRSSIRLSPVITQFIHLFPLDLREKCCFEAFCHSSGALTVGSQSLRLGEGKYPKYLQNSDDTCQISIAMLFVVGSWCYQRVAKENSVAPWLVSWVLHFLLSWNEIYACVFRKKHSWIPKCFDKFSEAWTCLSCVGSPPLHSAAFPLSRCINHIHNESTMFFWDNFETQSVLDYRKKRDPSGKWHASSCGSLFLSIYLSINLSIHPFPLSTWLFAGKWRENVKPLAESFLHAHLGRSLNITKQVQQRIRQHFSSWKHTELCCACYVCGSMKNEVVHFWYITHCSNYHHASNVACNTGKSWCFWFFLSFCLI